MFRRETKMGHKYFGSWLWNCIQKENQNIVVDALSRKEEDTNGLLCAIFFPQYDLVEEARIKWQQDENICKIIQQL